MGKWDNKECESNSLRYLPHLWKKTNLATDQHFEDGIAVIAKVLADSYKHKHEADYS